MSETSMCASCAKMRDSSDREFIEQKWRFGVREAEYMEGADALGDVRNPYAADSLAGIWWLRGYESMRAILKASAPLSPDAQEKKP